MGEQIKTLNFVHLDISLTDEDSFNEEIDWWVKGGGTCSFNWSDVLSIRQWFIDVSRLAGMPLLTGQLVNANDCKLSLMFPVYNMYRANQYQGDVRIGVHLGIRYEYAFLTEINRHFSVMLNKAKSTDSLAKNHRLSISYDVYSQKIKDVGIYGIHYRAFSGIESVDGLRSNKYLLYQYKVFDILTDAEYDLVVKMAGVYLRSRYHSNDGGRIYYTHGRNYFSVEDVAVLLLAKEYDENKTYKNRYERVHQAYEVMKNDPDAFFPYRQLVYKRMLAHDAGFMAGAGLYSLNKTLIG